MRSSPPTSSSDDQDSSQEEGSTSRVNRQRIHPDQARDRFFPSRLEATGVDFSDRISSQSKSYHVRKSRPRRKGSTRAGESADSSDEEGETLARRIARLKREVEEVQSEIANAETVKENSKSLGVSETATAGDMDSIAKLSSILTTLKGHQLKPAPPTHNLDLVVTVTPKAKQEPSQSPSSPLPTNTQTAIDTTRVLTKAVALESRLSALEATLGIPSTLLPPSSSPLTSLTRSNKPILTHLDTLEAHMTTLSTTTLPTLESLKSQIDALSTSAARLAEARAAATSAQAALLAAQTSRSPDLAAALEDARSATAEVDDPVLVAQVEALYAALPTVEALAPLLPATLERLRSLRGLHANAAAVGGVLAELEARQAGMEGEIAKWREGLERVEAAAKRGGAVMAGNREVVEGWVRELEARVESMMEAEGRS